MSSNRLLYDECASANHTNDNKNQLSWVMENNRFQNNNKCMVDLGVSSGNNNVRNEISDRIDIETKLLGIGNYDTKCKGASKIEDVSNELPSCNFYNGDLKPANVAENKATNNRCNGNVE